MTNTTQRNNYATDTMGLILRIEKRKLSQKVKKIFNEAESGQTTIYIPTIVFAEILYLSERQRIQISIHDVAEYLERFPNYKESPLSFEMIMETSRIKDIKELHDRLIAGTARFHNIPLITNDPVIEASEYVDTIW